MTPKQRKAGAAIGLRCEHPFCAPVGLSLSVMNKLNVNTSVLTPLHNGFGESESSQIRVVSLISRLLFLCCPVAVFRRIRAVVIAPINRVLQCWGLTHVGKKVLERVPSFADEYAASSVVRVIDAGFVGATLHHQSPSVVFLGDFLAIRPHRLPVFGVSGKKCLTMQATAGLRVPAGQLPGSNFNDPAAVALTCPFCRTQRNATGPVTNGEDSKASESFSCSINKARHFFTLKWFTVMDAWQSAVNRFSGATLAKRFYFNSGIP